MYGMAFDREQCMEWHFIGINEWGLYPIVNNVCIYTGLMISFQGLLRHAGEGKGTAPGLPTWSPTVVLAWPDAA